MKLSTREKWMAALIPAVLTGLIYQHFYMRPTHSDVEGLRKKIQTQGPLAARTANLQHEAFEHTRLERLVAAKNKPDTTGRTLDFNRTAALQQISKLCEAGGLTLLKSTPESAPRLPPSVEQVAKLIVKPGSQGAPQVWRLEVRSSYPGMIELLDGLAQIPSLVIPLSVGMQPDADETRPLLWTLTVWM